MTSYSTTEALSFQIANCRQHQEVEKGIHEVCFCFPKQYGHCKPHTFVIDAQKFSEQELAKKIKRYEVLGRVIVEYAESRKGKYDVI
jgi:hypothetical protein